MNAPATIAAERPRALAFLPRRLFRAEGAIAYVGLAWLLSLLPSLALSAVVSQLLPQQGPEFPPMAPGLLFFLLVIFAPAIETLIMGGALLVLNRLFGFLPAILLSALGWGVAHSLQAPAWGLVIWWPFLIFSTAFLVWRRRGVGWAFLIPFLIHALQNAGPALLMLSGIEV